ncbi:MAG: hypothetical protein DMG79_21375 [Acidobacteria bacterium]|nr:MAG: hypothetical protein DMG79_21375 [Acidobacteriota bacterium]
MFPWNELANAASCAAHLIPMLLDVNREKTRGRKFSVRFQVPLGDRRRFFVREIHQYSQTRRTKKAAQQMWAVNVEQTTRI